MTATITKYDPSGKIIYIGPNVRRGWERPETDEKGCFTINEDSYLYTDAKGILRRGGRPMGCTFPAKRPGRLIQPALLEGRIW